jgi:hypothetical protein
LSSHRIIALGVLILLIPFCVLPAAAGEITLTASSPQVLVKGDTMTLSGTQATNGTCAVWVIGRQYFDVKTVNPDKKGMLTFVIKPEETRKFSTGQYAVLVQDPGKNGGLEIEPLYWSDGIKIANMGKIIDQIGLKENLRGDVHPAVDTILSAVNRSKTDDSFTSAYISVEDPEVNFNKILDAHADLHLPTQTTGEQITITGTTQVGPENTLRVAIIDRQSGAVIVSKPVPVVAGTNRNSWSFTLSSPGLSAGNYSVQVGWLKSDDDVLGTALLTIRESNVLSPTPLPESPGEVAGLDVFFPLIISLAALVIIGIIIVVSLRD